MRNQKGAIVVEATISLSAFIFAIFMILSIVNICFVQAKIGVALNIAAKEISQYSYLYYALNLDELDASVSSGTQDEKQLAKDTIDGVGNFMDSLSNAEQSASNCDFEQMIADINGGVDNVKSLTTKYADALKDDPKGFILGMGKMAMSELKEEAKVVLAQVLAKTFMQKNLMTNKNDDADAYLRRYHVVDGMDGLDFNYTTFLAYGNSNEIQLVVTYEVQVIQLLNVDFKFKIRQCSKTTAWGNGISVMNPEQNEITKSEQNIWDLGPGVRGKEIVATEKKDYKYVDSGQGFDAYNNAGGKNEFVTIMSTDTALSSNDTSDEIKRNLQKAYNDIYDDVNDLGESIQVQTQNGETVTITSNPESRTYKIVMVIPDDADMKMIAKAVKEFEAENPGVKVVVRNGYGSSSGKSGEETEN